jgi:hypothetical protein
MKDIRARIEKLITDAEDCESADCDRSGKARGKQGDPRIETGRRTGLSALNVANRSTVRARGCPLAPEHAAIERVGALRLCPAALLGLGSAISAISATGLQLRSRERIA